MSPELTQLKWMDFHSTERGLHTGDGEYAVWPWQPFQEEPKGELIKVFLEERTP